MGEGGGGALRVYETAKLQKVLDKTTMPHFCFPKYQYGSIN